MKCKILITKINTKEQNNPNFGLPQSKLTQKKIRKDPAYSKQKQVRRSLPIFIRHSHSNWLGSEPSWKSRRPITPLHLHLHSWFCYFIQTDWVFFIFFLFMYRWYWVIEVYLCVLPPVLQQLPRWGQIKDWLIDWLILPHYQRKLWKCDVRMAIKRCVSSRFSWLLSCCHVSSSFDFWILVWLFVRQDFICH